MNNWETASEYKIENPFSGEEQLVEEMKILNLHKSLDQNNSDH